MIDLHSHILPGIDDGAQNLDEALGLARAAVANGISHCVCTPHIHFGRFDNNLDSIGAALKQLKRALVEQQIPLQIAMAAEVRFDVEIMAAIADQQLPFLGRWQDRRVLLLEFPHGEMPVGAERLTQWLLSQGIQPLIAHPERNKGVMRRPEVLKPFIQQGCLLQITAGSVVGGFGERAEELALQLLADDLVTLVATDTHHIKRRPPMLREAYQRIESLHGEALADRLTVDVPWSIASEHFS